jgi:pyrimidine-nucleoside phosphorylase
VEHQGGDPRALDDYGRLPAAHGRLDVGAAQTGHVSALHAELVGRAAVALGAGRATLDDKIDAGVGIEIVAPVGTTVRSGEPVLRVHHRDGRGLEDAVALLRQAIAINDAPEPRPLVIERIA